MNINGELVEPLRANRYGYTGAFNMTGHPAISIPMSHTADGMPAGLYALGRWFEEQRLRDLAAASAERQPWSDSWPTVVSGARP